jgi:hypothetical protein
VFENRQCGAGGIPLPLSAVGVNPALIPPTINSLIGQAIFNAGGGGGTPAPPCVLAPDFTTPGGTTHYPHVVVRPPPR